MRRSRGVWIQSSLHVSVCVCTLNKRTSYLFLPFPVLSLYGSFLFPLYLRSCLFSLSFGFLCYVVLSFFSIACSILSSFIFFYYFHHCHFIIFISFFTFFYLLSALFSSLLPFLSLSLFPFHFINFFYYLLICISFLFVFPFYLVLVTFL